MHFVYIKMVLGQSTGLSKEVCLHAGTDWPKLTCQSVWQEILYQGHNKGYYDISELKFINMIEVCLTFHYFPNATKADQSYLLQGVLQLKFLVHGIHIDLQKQSK